MKIILSLLLIIVVGFGGLMFWKAFKSHSTPANVGMVDGKLKACGTKPNCVSSFAEEGTDFFFAPIQDNNIEVIWDNLNVLIDDMGLKIVSANENYIHAEAITPLMRFVDDVEFLLDEANSTIHMRSVSRVGYSDMGANRKRLNAIKKALVGSPGIE